MVAKRLALISFKFTGKEKISTCDIQRINTIREFYGGEVFEFHRRRVPHEYFEQEKIKAQLRIGHTSLFLMKDWEGCAVSRNAPTALTDIKMLERKLREKKLLKKPAPKIMTPVDYSGHSIPNVIVLLSYWLSPLVLVFAATFGNNSEVLLVALVLLLAFAIGLTLITMLEKIMTWWKIRKYRYKKL